MATQEAIRVLAADTAQGASAVTFTQDADRSAFRVGADIVIDPYTVEAELHRIKAVSGATVTLERPLAYAHQKGDRVFAATGGVWPWDWFGARKGSAAYATDNVLAFNRLAAQLYVVAPASRIEIPPGVWHVNDELRPERDQGIKGYGPTASQIVATSDFPFDGTGEVAIIHPQRDGNPTGYAATNYTVRCYIEDLYVNGAGVPNSNGILLKVQQPAASRNLRVDNCRGLYGLCVSGQDGQFLNVELIGNTVPLRLRGASLMLFDDLNIEQTKGQANVILENGAEVTVCVWNTFRQVHFEAGPPAPNPVGFDIKGGSSAFSCHDLYYSNGVNGTCFRFDTPQANPGGACRYVLTNIWCNQNAQTFKIVDDIQRGKSVTSWNTASDRWIDILTPRILMAGYTVTP